MGGPIDQSMGPGLGGFLAFFLLACALWLLMRNMGKHLRNVAYLSEREAEQEARAGYAPTGDSASDQAGDHAVQDVQTRPRTLSAGYPAEQDRT